VHGLWLRDIESLEAISQDDDTRMLFLRLVELSQLGRMAPFLLELEQDTELDDATKASVAELAGDPTFLHAVDEYVHRTRALH
jgi:hypothetical protein